jgi:hypothetical protein
MITPLVRVSLPSVDPTYQALTYFFLFLLFSLLPYLIPPWGERWELCRHADAGSSAVAREPWEDGRPRAWEALLACRRPWGDRSRRGEIHCHPARIGELPAWGCLSTCTPSSRPSASLSTTSPSLCWRPRPPQVALTAPAPPPRHPSLQIVVQ